jgi:ATP-dependent DNA helicase RecG
VGLNERQIRAINYVNEKGRITNKGYQSLNNCPRNTAFNDLSDLTKRKILKDSGKNGKGILYVIEQ